MIRAVVINRCFEVTVGNRIEYKQDGITNEGQVIDIKIEENQYIFTVVSKDGKIQIKASDIVTVGLLYDVSNDLARTELNHKLRRDGTTYFDHARDVSYISGNIGYDIQYCDDRLVTVEDRLYCIAHLHDLLEDTDWTEQDLREFLKSCVVEDGDQDVDFVVDNVVALSCFGETKEDRHNDAIIKLTGCSIETCVVKLADISSNFETVELLSDPMKYVAESIEKIEAMDVQRFNNEALNDITNEILNELKSFKV
jgi:(p)ppGpp synthase/HD superfamily hydrolase